MSTIRLTSQEIQVFAVGLDSMRWSGEHIKHAQSAAKKVFKQAERYEPALIQHLIEMYPQAAELAGRNPSEE
jgi:predicted DNA-binding transcriptional regulator YafY